MFTVGRMFSIPVPDMAVLPESIAGFRPKKHKIDIVSDFYKSSQGVTNSWHYRRKLNSSLAKTHVLTDKVLESRDSNRNSRIQSGDLDPVDHKYILLGKSSGGMAIHDTTKGLNGKYPKVGVKIAGSANTHPGGVNCIQWYPMDAGLFSTSSTDNLIKIWDPNTMDNVDVFDLGCRIHHHHMSPVASKHSLIAAAAGSTGEVILCDLRSGSSTHRLTGHVERVQVVQWARHNDHLLASGGKDKCIRVWDVRSGRACVETLAGKGLRQSHSSLVTTLTFSHDGLWLISYSFDGTIKLWDTGTFTEQSTTFRNTKNHFRNAVTVPITYNLFPDLIFVPHRCYVSVFDLTTGALVNVLKGHCNAINGAVYNPVTGDLYTFGEDRNFLVWTPKLLVQKKEDWELTDRSYSRIITDAWTSSDED